MENSVFWLQEVLIQHASCTARLARAQGSSEDKSETSAHEQVAGFSGTAALKSTAGSSGFYGNVSGEYADTPSQKCSYIAAFENCVGEISRVNRGCNSLQVNVSTSVFQVQNLCL